MKKKILFINKSFTIGGIQTALNNMLSNINDKYDIDLFLFYNHGPLKTNLPPNINVIEADGLLQTFGMTFKEIMHNGSLLQKIFKVFSCVWIKLFNNIIPIRIALKYQRPISGYDVAIAYHHEPGIKASNSGFNRFLIDKVKCDKKIGWIHSDFAFYKNKIINKENKDIYSKLDEIINVSKACAESFIKCYPELSHKCDYCYNYLDVEKIISKSMQNEDIPFDNNATVLFTACRLDVQKDLPRAIMAFKKSGVTEKNIKWYIAGTGIEKEKIENLISELELQEFIFLIGMKSNPYPYFRKADIYFMTSVHETFGMVIAEARILGLKVLTTDIPVARELLSKNDGFITDNSEEGIIKGLLYIVNNIEFFKKDENNVWRIEQPRNFEDIIPVS